MKRCPCCHVGELDERRVCRRCKVGVPSDWERAQRYTGQHVLEGARPSYKASEPSFENAVRRIEDRR